jgi:NAD(P)-dependent dehydrogenase (short-subunit alcohol dehydrogenase family)
MELKGKSALVTGASGGLGSRIALGLARGGCKCVCHYHSNKERCEAVVAEIKKGGGEAIAVGADLRRPEEIEGLFDKAAGLGVVQVLVNSAAVFSRGALGDISFAEAQLVFGMNLAAPILVSRVFAERLGAATEEGESIIGKIVNIADVGGIRPWAKYVLYCSSKAGLIGATKALAKELAPRVCVNAVAPGMVTWPEGFGEEAKQRQLALIPVGRIAQPGEIARAVVFLAENDYVTGQVLNVDGGRCI